MKSIFKMLGLNDNETFKREAYQIFSGGYLMDGKKKNAL